MKRPLTPFIPIAIVLLSAFPFAGQSDSNGARRRVVAHPQICDSGVVATAGGVIDLTVNDCHVYFSDSAGSVWRVDITGGEPERLASVSNAIGMSVAADSSRVYFQVRDSNGLDSVYALPKNGGEPKLLVTALRSVLEMIADGDWLYVLAAGSIGPPPWPSDGRILRVKKDGSAVETLAAPLRVPMSMRLDGDNICFTEAGTSTSDKTGGVRRMAKSGGAVTSVATVPLAWALALDGKSIYVLRVTGSDLGAIDVVSKSDGTVTPLVSAVSFEPVEPMEIAGGSLYFMHLASSSSARIESIPLSGGERRVVKEFARNFPQFAVDSCAVYFSTPSGIERARY